jgi:hypothetical protein
MAGYDVYEPNYKNFGKKGVGLYRNFLTRQLGGQGGYNVEQLYRNQAYRDIGRQQSNATKGARQSIASSFGARNPTGLDSALRSQIALESPYGAADIGAREAGRKAMLQSGAALEQSKLNQAGWYNTLMSTLIQNAMMQQAINQANAAGGTDWGSILGGGGQLLSGASSTGVFGGGG